MPVVHSPATALVPSRSRVARLSPALSGEFRRGGWIPVCRRSGRDTRRPDRGWPPVCSRSAAGARSARAALALGGGRRELRSSAVAVAVASPVGGAPVRGRPAGSGSTALQGQSPHSRFPNPGVARLSPPLSGAFRRGGQVAVLRRRVHVALATRSQARLSALRSGHSPSRMRVNTQSFMLD
jgi:hypothetical protein